MLRLARSFVASPQSAEDVVQEAWLGMLSGLARFEGRSSLRTWTFTILVNRARTRGAREARTVPQPPLADRGERCADDWFPGPGDEAARTWSSIDAASRWDAAPESAVLSREALRQLDRAVSALPSRQRQVVTMRDIEGMSAEEVCAALGVSAANQRVLLHRARVALRTALTGYYRG
jgi:RNA polymerase sigma-70 factor (ECF subfamily)